MYSEEDINSAVSAGALSADAAAAFRAHMTQVRDMPRGDEENFRLINSFNDIFVAIGVVIMLVAAGAIGQAIASAFAPVPNIWDLTSEPTEAQFAAWSAASEWRSALTTLFAGALIAATAWPPNSRRNSASMTRKRWNRWAARPRSPGASCASADPLS